MIHSSHLPYTNDSVLAEKNYRMNNPGFFLKVSRERIPPFRLTLWLPNG